MGMDLIAKILLGAAFSLTCLTIPNDPCPTVLIISNSFSKDQLGVPVLRIVDPERDGC
jgi:hypothetical protein